MGGWLCGFFFFFFNSKKKIPLWIERKFEQKHRWKRTWPFTGHVSSEAHFSQPFQIAFSSCHVWLLGDMQYYNRCPELSCQLNFYHLNVQEVLRTFYPSSGVMALQVTCVSVFRAVLLFRLLFNSRDGEQECIFASDLLLFALLTKLQVCRLCLQY